jgi:hypothetical protein
LQAGRPEADRESSNVTAMSDTGHEHAGQRDNGPRHTNADADEDRVAERAHLLPEEITAGSADPTAQAEQILLESDRRTDEPEQTQQESVQANEKANEGP